MSPSTSPSRRTHGFSEEPEYAVWKGMQGRMKKPITELWPVPRNETVLLGFMVTFWIGWICGSFVQIWSQP